MKGKCIDLFSGIGGIRLGLEKANKQIGKVRGQGKFRQTRVGFSCIWANDNDKYACQIYRKHWGEICEQDIRTIDPATIPEHDLITAGFPCQSFSIAGHRGGFADTRGTLFFEICRIAGAKRTPHLLLENVKGLLSAPYTKSIQEWAEADFDEFTGEPTAKALKKHKAIPGTKGWVFLTILNSLWELGYSLQWMVLNSKDYGVPQNRERVYIIGHLRGRGRRQIFPIGEDAEMVDGIRQETQIIYANYSEREICRVYNPKGLAPALHLKTGGLQEPKIAGALSGGGHSGGLHSDMTVIPVLTPDRTKKRQRGRRMKENGEPMFTLTGQDIHGVVVHNLQPRTGNPKEGGTGHLTRKDGIAYALDSGATQAVAPSVTTEMAHGTGFNQTPKVVEAIGEIRRLTPIECERLQGFPDNWTKWGLTQEGKLVEISDTQRYKCCGNAATTLVVEAVGRQLLNEK